jgi:two-component system, chemotaxis family, response regulator WspR
LVKIARVLRSATRKTSDLVGRYGGEEFVVVLPNTDSSGAERAAQNMIDRVKDMQIPHVSSDVSGYVTISLGVATAIPNRGTSPKMLLEIAD